MGGVDEFDPEAWCDGNRTVVTDRLKPVHHTSCIEFRAKRQPETVSAIIVAIRLPRVLFLDPR